jgi:hypothetical protein
MKFEIVMVVEGGPELEGALNRGHFESGVSQDVLESGESIESFTFKKLED